MRVTFSAVTLLSLVACAYAELGSDGKVQVYKGKPNCQIPSRGSAPLKRIIEGLSYLAGKGGQQMTLPAGPGKCTRISCSYKSAIHWCNDDNKEITVDLAAIAGVAFDITNQCNQGGSDFNGQEWNSSSLAGGWNWNVVIEAADC